MLQEDISVIKGLINDKNINLKIKGKTPLILAMEQNDVELVSLLLEHGANPHVKVTTNTSIMVYLKIRNYQKMYPKSCGCCFI